MRQWLIALTFLFSCLAAAQDDDYVSSVAREWLEIVDAGHYLKSYQLTDDAFKIEMSAAHWQEALNMIRLPLGEVVWRNEVEQEKLESLPGRPDGEYVTIVFETKFEHASAIIETITLSKKSGDWLPVGYFMK